MNKQITRLSVATLVLLVSLIVGTTYWQTWAAPGLADRQDNSIQRVAQFKIKRGLIYGASDPTGAEPERDAVSIEDLACTVYDRLGIDSDKKLMSPGDRPIDIVRGGKVIKEICA